MRQKIKKGAVSLAAFGMAIFLLAQPALAEMEVLESSAPQISVGDKLADDAQLDLPKGAKLRLLLTTTGETKTLKGPYKGEVANYKEKRNWWERLFGKKRDPEPPMGAVRGAVAPPK
ncbi:MAG: hypothetical protein P8Y67_10000 [Alphaproteobacteria bacterium]